MSSHPTIRRREAVPRTKHINKKYYIDIYNIYLLLYASRCDIKTQRVLKSIKIIRNRIPTYYTRYRCGYYVQCVITDQNVMLKNNVFINYITTSSKTRNFLRPL